MFGTRDAVSKSTLAQTLAVLSILSTLAVVEIWGVQYRPIGFEATLVLGGYCLWLALVSAVSALVIASVRARSGKRADFFLIALLSSLSLLGLASLFVMMLLAGLQ